MTLLRSYVLDFSKLSTSTGFYEVLRAKIEWLPGFLRGYCTVQNLRGTGSTQFLRKNFRIFQVQQMTQGFHGVYIWSLRVYLWPSPTTTNKCSHLPCTCTLSYRTKQATIYYWICLDTDCGTQSTWVSWTFGSARHLSAVSFKDLWLDCYLSSGQTTLSTRGTARSACLIQSTWIESYFAYLDLIWVK